MATTEKGWSILSKYCLVNSVEMLGLDNWLAVCDQAKSIYDDIYSVYSEYEEQNPDYFSPDRCASQFETLWKSYTKTEIATFNLEHILKRISRILRTELMQEVLKRMALFQVDYMKVKKEQEEILAGNYDSNILDLFEMQPPPVPVEIEQSKAENNFVTPTKVDKPEKEEKTNITTSPLLTSLLQSPSPITRPSLSATTSTISLLLNSSQSSNETTLSKLLESSPGPQPSTSKLTPIKEPQVEVSVPVSPEKEAKEQIVIEEIIEQEIPEVINQEKITEETMEIPVEEMNIVEESIIEPEIINEVAVENLEQPVTEVILEASDINELSTAAVEVIEGPDKNMVTKGNEILYDPIKLEPQIEVDREEIVIKVVDDIISSVETSIEEQYEEANDIQVKTELVPKVENEGAEVEENVFEMSDEDESSPESFKTVEILSSEDKLAEILPDQTSSPRPIEILFEYEEKPTIDVKNNLSPVEDEETVEDVICEVTDNPVSVDNDMEYEEITPDRNDPDDEKTEINEQEIEVEDVIQTNNDSLQEEDNFYRASGDAELPTSEKKVTEEYKDTTEDSQESDVVSNDKDDESRKDPLRRTKVREAHKKPKNDPSEEKKVVLKQLEEDVPSPLDIKKIDPDKGKLSRTRNSLSSLSDSKPNSPSLSISNDDDKDYKVWKKTVLGVINSLRGHSTASLFLKPITLKDADDYHLVVKQPTDLTTIKKKIDNGVLRTTVEVQRELLMMVQNALVYNDIGSMIHQRALIMLNYVKTQMTNMVRALGSGIPFGDDDSDREEKLLTRGRSSIKPQPQASKRKRSSVASDTPTSKRKKN